MTDPRTRTITWDNPATSRMLVGRIPGREYLQEMLAGRLPQPPVAMLIGFDTMTVSDGECRLELVPSEFHTNPMGTVHGGILATLLDTVLGCALMTQLAPGEGYTTATLEIKYLRPVTVATRRILALGRVVYRGRTLATTEGTLTDSSSKLFATATSTLSLFNFPVSPNEASAIPALATQRE